MKDWLKFTFLGFFNPNYSNLGRGRKFVNALLSLFFFLGLLPILMATGDLFSFSFKLGNESTLKSAINHMFVVNKIDYKYSNHIIKSEHLINTYESESDSIYKYEDFNLIFDVREQNTTYDDFIFTCKNKNGEEVAYSPKYIGDENFVFSFEYSGQTFDTLERKDTYLNYLEDISNPESDNYNKFAKTDFDKLKALKDDLLEKDYINKAYELYVQYYYPNLEQLGSASSIPILRGYYLKKYITQPIAKNSIMVFDNLITINFENKYGQICVHDGYLSTVNIKPITITSTSTDIEMAKSINGLLTNAFQNGFGLEFTIYLINVFRIMPFVLFFVILFALIDWLIRRKKVEKPPFLDNCIVYSSLINIPSIAVGIIGLFLTMIFARGIAFSISVYTLLALILIRGIVELISLFKLKKERPNEEELGND